MKTRQKNWHDVVSLFMNVPIHDVLTVITERMIQNKTLRKEPIYWQKTLWATSNVSCPQHMSSLAVNCTNKYSTYGQSDVMRHKIWEYNIDDSFEVVTKSQRCVTKHAGGGYYTPRKSSVGYRWSSVSDPVLRTAPTVIASSLQMSQRRRALFHF